MLEIVNITKFCEFQLEHESLFRILFVNIMQTAKCELNFHFTIRMSLRLGIAVFFFLFDARKKKTKMKNICIYDSKESYL